MSAPADEHAGAAAVETGRWQRVSRHLDRVLDLPEVEWADYLAALNREDPITGTDVQRLLHSRQHPDFAEFLGETSRPPPIEPPASLIGRRVGPYIFEAEIGRGGMGSVWRARRADGRFEGHVAIKLLHLAWLGRAGEQRFLLEGQLLARLDHPNIARLIDAGVLEGGQPYLVLEYVEGEPIDAYCERTAVGIEARVALFLEAAAAVAHAHRHLIVHRDLKPSNVLVTRSGTVKLLDFGIAKLVDAGAEAAPTQTLLHGLTPQYAAPEQLLGQSVTTATDVYALGLMLYLLLAGRHPFASWAQASREGRSGELIRAMIDERPPRASAVAAGPAARRRTLRGDLDNILAKALEREPADRYGTVGALAEDLRRFLAHEPVQARPLAAGYRVRKFVRRHRWGVGAAVSIAAALIGATGFASVQMLEARAQRDRAVAEAQRAQAQEDLTEFVIGDSLNRAPANAVHARLDRARQFIAKRYRQSPLLAAQLLFDVSGRYIDIGDELTAAQVIRDIESMNRRLNDPDLKAELACTRSEDLTLARELPAAKTQLATGLASLESSRNVRPQTRAECADASALMLQAEGNYSQAVARLVDARRQLIDAGLYGASRYTSTTNNLERAMILEGDFRSAWALQRDLLALMRELGRDDTANWWPMVTNACIPLLRGGQPRRAAELVGGVLAEARRGNPTFEPPYMVTGCQAAGRMLAGDAEAADPQLMQTNRAAEAAGTGGSKFFATLTVIAAIKRGDLAAADARWAGLQPSEGRARAGARDAASVSILITHARVDLAHGRAGDASKQLQAAARLIAARNQPINPDAYDVAVLSARASLQMGDPRDAERQAEKALALARISSVDEGASALIGEALLRRAQAERALGKSAQAAATARESLRQLQSTLLPRNPLLAASRSLIGDATTSALTASPETQPAPPSAPR